MQNPDRNTRGIEPLHDVAQSGSQGMTSRTHVALKDGVDVAFVPFASFTRKIGVNDLVRLQLAEFALLEQITGLFTHFNFGRTHNVAGCRYAFLPILKPGSRPVDGPETLPVVDAIRRRRGICLSVTRGVRLQDVPADAFAHSLPTISNADTLLAALLLRYPGLNDKDILSEGCTVTRFSMEGAVLPSTPPPPGWTSCASRIGLPPPKWFALKYGFEPLRGRTNADEDPQA